MREKQKNSNSPLAKFLPGGSLSSDSRHQENRQSESSVLENEMIEQLQLELEEARRTIRSHEGKILQLQEGWRSFWSNYDSFLTHLLTGSEFSHTLDFKPWALLTLVALITKAKPKSILLEKVGY